MDLFRTKIIGSDVHADTGLHRTLGAGDLVLLGIGAIIGAGVFVLTGVAAATQAGPALVLSFVLAGLACVFAGLSYAELAAAVGGCGSAYGYAYATLGEIVAWIIGWALMLEYGMAVSAVAVGWSGYFNNALTAGGIHLPNTLLAAPHAGGLVNLPAMGIIILLGFLLAIGVKNSARFNAAIVFIKLTAIAIFVIIALGNVDPDNWTPFMPFGWQGIVNGAALIFFAYIGFDAVSTAAEEARNPQRDMPIGIIGSLAICTAVYMIVAALLTGIAPYPTLNTPSPVSQALLTLGYQWGAAVVAAGAIAGLTSVMLVMYYGQTRVLFAMSRDGLLPQRFATVSPRTRTPTFVILLTGAITSIVAGFAPIGAIAQLVNIGTLFAFVIVCVGVVVLRYKRPDLHRPFRVPFSPVLPLLGVIFCLYLMVSLPAVTWFYFLLWMAFGLVIYGGYSARASRRTGAVGG
ncbi:MAG TPA: amino acid permease [Gammaproteobacteria bacterium]|nr:amino acid permease [Gammaproteobacteria bacterium]